MNEFEHLNGLIFSAFKMIKAHLKKVEKQFRCVQISEISFAKKAYCPLNSVETQVYKYKSSSFLLKVENERNLCGELFRLHAKLLLE